VREPQNASQASVGFFSHGWAGDELPSEAAIGGRSASEADLSLDFCELPSLGTRPSEALKTLEQAPHANSLQDDL
jgi:hypothetical protein